MCTGQFQVASDLPMLDGHFPGRPVLPAVATIELAIAWLRAATDRPDLNLSEVKNAKFTAPIEPPTTVQVAAREISAGEWQLDLSEPSSGRDLASLRLLLHRD